MLQVQQVHENPLAGRQLLNPGCHSAPTGRRSVALSPQPTAEQQPAGCCSIKGLEWNLGAMINTESYAPVAAAPLGPDATMAWTTQVPSWSMGG